MLDTGEICSHILNSHDLDLVEGACLLFPAGSHSQAEQENPMMGIYQSVEMYIHTTGFERHLQKDGALKANVDSRRSTPRERRSQFLEQERC